MQKPLKSKKSIRAVEINWNIREHFSEGALSNFIGDIDTQYLSKKKRIISLNRPLAHWFFNAQSHVSVNPSSNVIFG